MDKKKLNEQLIIDDFYSLLVKHINKNGNKQMHQHSKWKSDISFKLIWIILYITIEDNKVNGYNEKNNSAFAIDFIVKKLKVYDSEKLLNFCSGIESPDFTFIDHLSFEFNINSNWLLYGEGLPFIEKNN